MKSDRIISWRDNIHHGYSLQRPQQLQATNNYPSAENAEKYENLDDEDDASYVDSEFTTFDVINRRKDMRVMTPYQNANNIVDHIGSWGETESRDRELDPSEY